MIYTEMAANWATAMATAIKVLFRGFPARMVYLKHDI